MKHTLVFIFLFLHCLLQHAQETGFIVRNYTAREYDGFNQVWCATQDSAGVMYFGTSTNIITFDGRKWDKIFVKQGVPIRSLAIKDGRIYVGAEGEFGYLDRKPDKRVFYVSLVSQLSEQQAGFTDIWKILQWKGKLVFQCNERIFIYDGTKFATVEPKTSFALAFVTDGRFFVRQRDVGMMELNENGKLQLVKGGEFFKQVPVIAFEKDDTGNEFVAGGSRDGVMFYDEASGVTRVLENSKNAVLVNLFPLTLSRQENGTWFLTTRAGFFVLNSDFSIKHVFNKYNGLYDDVVTASFFSRDGNLWLCLNNGISMIEWDSDGIYLTEKSGYKGGPEDILLNNGIYYLATSHSIYSLPYSSVAKGEFEFSSIDCEVTEYWDLIRVGSKVFASATAGIYEIKGNKAEKFSSNWGRYLLKISDSLPYLISLQKNSISIFNVSSPPVLKNEIEYPGEEFHHGYLEVKDDEYRLWTTTLSGNVFRFAFDRELNLKGKKIYTSQNGLGVGLQNIYCLEAKPGEPGAQRKIFLPILNKIYTYVPEKDLDSNSVCFEQTYPFDVNKEFRLADNFNGKLFVGKSYTAYARRRANGNYLSTLYSLKQSPLEFTSYVTDDSLRTWFLSPEYTVLIKNIRAQPRFKDVPVLFTYIRAGKDSSSIYYGVPDNNVFDYRSNSFTFEYASPFFTEPALTWYRCRLLGSSDTSWTKWGVSNHKEYTNLHEGDYEFCVQARTVFGDVGAERGFHFTVLPPWYRTGWAYLLYALAFVGLTVFIVRVSNYRLQQSKIKLENLVNERTHELQEKKKEITDSIKYALRIQTAILPPDTFLKKLLPDSFTFYRPKDIVSGDFYWVEEIRGKVLFAAVDCTGHGVPGAMMSVIGLRLLNSAVNDRRLDTPSDILNFLDKGIHETLRQGDAGSGVKDGMDLAICTWDKPAGVLEYAGVCNSLWLVRKNISKTWKVKSSREVLFGNDLLEIKPDKLSIGNNTDGKGDSYTNHYLKLEPGDCVYVYSDGYADQFGGPNGKKFKYNRLKELLVTNAHHSMAEQEKILGRYFDEWKGSNEQIDDVLVMGVRV